MSESPKGRPVRLALLGPPGSGKGTQAAALARELGVPVVSTGDLLRARAAEDPDAWHELATRLRQGDLVPDDLVLSVVNDALNAPAMSDGYVLDGFPRTIVQAEHPETPPVDVVINLHAPDDVVRSRIARRADVRADDADRAAVERRLHLYHSDTAPLLDLYGREGVLTSVDATESPEAVTTAILRALGLAKP